MTDYKMNRLLKDNVLAKLREAPLPLCKTRKNVSSQPYRAMSLGEVSLRGQWFLDYKTRGDSQYNRKFPELYESIKALIAFMKPDFSYTTIQINKNKVCRPHIDSNNVGESYIIALGDFTGGELVVEGKPSNIKNRFKKFDGTLGHWTAPFEGERYSIVFFTHTFKPPSSAIRTIRITKKGMYKKGELIKAYESSETNQ